MQPPFANIAYGSRTSWSLLLRSVVRWRGCLLIRLLAYVKAAVRRFVSTEVHVRASLARSFYWTELCAYPEDLPAGSTILLSGKVSEGCVCLRDTLACCCN